MWWRTASSRAAVVFGLALIFAYRLGFWKAQRTTKKGKKAIGAAPKESSQNTAEAHRNRKRKADAKARDRKLALARAGENALLPRLLPHVLVTHELTLNTQEAAAREAYHETEQGNVPRRVRRAETVLSQRTSRLVLVLEGCEDRKDLAAVLRTAEALGLQHVWVIESAQGNRPKQRMKDVSLGAELWLTVTSFPTSEACILFAKQHGYSLWAVDFSPSPDGTAGGCSEPLPAQLAVVIGHELDGVTRQMLEAVDRRMSVQTFGFTESLNLSVASALVMDRLLHRCPAARGDLSQEERTAIRRSWYQKLCRNASTPGMKAQFEQYLATAEKEQIDILPDLRKKVELKGHSITYKFHKKVSIASTNEAARGESHINALTSNVN